MAETSSPLPENDPLKLAWEHYRRTDDYANSKHWAMRVAPMFYAGADEKTQRAQAEELMPHGMRERHVEGALCAAFSAGYLAAESSNG